MQSFKLLRKAGCALGMALILASTSTAASARSLKDCVGFLSALVTSRTTTTESTEFRRKYVEIARRKSANPILRDYIQKNLEKMNRILEEKNRQLPPPSPSFPDSLQLLLKLVSNRLFITTQNVTASPHLDLEAFNRLSRLYSQLFDFYLPESGSIYLWSRYKWRCERSTDSSSLLNLFASSSEELTAWVLNRSDKHLLTLDSELTEPLALAKGWTYVPTFANLGFRSLLWGFSRGLLFIGLSSEIQHVDGYVYLPSAFTGHDYAHANVLLRMTPTYKPSFAKFWDRLETQVEESSVDTEKKSLIYLTLFYLIHENMSLRLECPRELPDSSLLFKQVLSRLQEGDLGQALKQRPNSSILRDAIHDTRVILHSLCPDALF